MSLLRRITPILLALAAACGIYGEDDDEAPAPAPMPSVDDASVATSDAATGGPAVVSDQDSGLEPLESGTPDATAPIVDAGADHAGPLRDLYVFVTSVPISAKIAMISPEFTADTMCNELAEIRPKLGNKKFAAWLGSANISAQTRIADKAVGHRYIRPDGVVVTSDPQHMAGDKLTNSISVTDLDVNISLATEVWTGVGGDGATTASTCANWTTDSSTVFGVGGIANATSAWSQFGFYTCETKRRIYCFEVP